MENAVRGTLQRQALVWSVYHEGTLNHGYHEVTKNHEDHEE